MLPDLCASRAHCQRHGVQKEMDEGCLPANSTQGKPWPIFQRSGENHQGDFSICTAITYQSQCLHFQWIYKSTVFEICIWLVKIGLPSFGVSIRDGFLVLCSVTASFFTSKMCVSLMLFQKKKKKKDGPGPPLGNSLKRRIRNHHLMLGVEALCLHAESAEGGSGGVPVRVLAQQTLAALSCQYGGSIILSFKSLQCVCTYWSLHYNGPVNVCCSWGGGWWPCRFTAWTGMQFCFHWQFPPLIALGATFLLEMCLESSSRMRTGSGAYMEMMYTLPSLCPAFSCTKRGGEMRIRPFRSLVNLPFCVRSRVWHGLGGQTLSWGGHNVFKEQTAEPAQVPWWCCHIVLNEVWLECAFLKPTSGNCCQAGVGHKHCVMVFCPFSKGGFQQCHCQKFSCIIMVRIYIYFCVLRMVWWHKHKSEWKMRWFPSLLCSP